MKGHLDAVHIDIDGSSKLCACGTCSFFCFLLFRANAGHNSLNELHRQLKEWELRRSFSAATNTA